MFLERLDIKKANIKVLLNQLKSSTGCSDTVKSLAKIGNERLGSKELHTCCLCRKRFSRSLRLKLHIENVHYRKKRISCDLCTHVCFTKDAIFHHMLVHRTKKYACNICDYKTSFKQNFQKHRNHIFKKCSSCDEVFKKKVDLRR